MTAEPTTTAPTPPDPHPDTPQAPSDAQRAAEGAAQPDGEDWWDDLDVISWDWREQPNLDALGRLLARHGVTLTEVDTGSDQFAVRITGAEPMGCDTCSGSGWIRQEPQIGVPGSGVTHGCPDCEQGRARLAAGELLDDPDDEPGAATGDAAPTDQAAPGAPAQSAADAPTPPSGPLVVGRALLDRDGDVWRETWPDRWREPAHDTVRTRAELEQHLSPVCEVLLVDPSAGPTLDAAVQLRQAASLRAAESAEEALVAVAVGDTPGLDDADPELARKGSSPPAGHIGQPDPEPDGDIAPWCAMCRKAARADAPESADADLRRAGAVAMLRRIATAAEAAQAAYGRGYSADDLRQWADRIASGDLPVPGSDGEGPEHGTVSTPEPAGDGPGWDRSLVVELVDGIQRATIGGTAWYEVRDDDGAQLRALLADRDRLAAEHDWAYGELDTTRDDRDRLAADLGLARDLAVIADQDASRQIATLAEWIATHVPGEPSRSEGAVETAIRLLGQLDPDAYNEMRSDLARTERERDEARAELAAVDEQLRQAGIEHPLGHHGVQDLRMRSEFHGELWELASRLATALETLADAPDTSIQVADLLADARRAGLLPEETEASHE